MIVTIGDHHEPEAIPFQGHFTLESSFRFRVISRWTRLTRDYRTGAVYDAGPIIEQDVIRISHHDSVQETVKLGKDVEKAVLARGLSYHLDDRVLVHGNKTIVFR